MAITKVELKFPVGKSIIIGKLKEGNIVQVDGIVLHTAFTVSEHISLIENCQIDYSDRVIYICGHGNAKKGTIGGRTIEEIAELLKRANYQNQLIYLTSCDSNKNGYRPFYEKMVETYYSICSYLNFLLTGNRQRVVYSDADGSTITLKNNNGEPEIYVLKGIIEKWAYVYQYIHFQAIKSTGTIINVDIDLNKLEKECKLHYARINKFKEDLAVHCGMRTPKLRHRLSSFNERIKEILGIQSLG